MEERKGRRTSRTKKGIKQKGETNNEGENTAKYKEYTSAPCMQQYISRTQCTSICTGTIT
jgi:hypothetical protein